MCIRMVRDGMGKERKKGWVIKRRVERERETSDCICNLQNQLVLVL